jgi:hypothetical protein
VKASKELAAHSKQAKAVAEGTPQDRRLSIVEALLLAAVAILAAWSGYSSAKWGTVSRLHLAQASTARTEASRANLDANTEKNFDSSTFNAWFSAYVANNQPAMDLAAKRFRPEFRVAFDAWIATSPATNADAPPGPTYMPEYKQPLVDEANALDAKADALYAQGASDGGNADDYVRTTVFLATVLFMVGISGHFRFRAARVGLIVVGGSILVYAVILLLQAPKPPG